MTRILILIFLGFILYKLVKHLFASADAKPKTRPSAKQSKPLTEEKMIQCVKCGCHVPVSESITNNNQLICNNPECNQ